MMKKNLLSTLALPIFFLFLIFAVPPLTNAARERTIVTGEITDSSNHPIKKADVTVTCVHNGTSTTKQDKTNAVGIYRVQFGGNKCNDGDTVTVTANKSGVGAGSGTGVVFGETKKLNVAIVNVAVPEFGMMTGAVALLTSVGGFFALKKKQIVG